MSEHVEYADQEVRGWRLREFALMVVALLMVAIPLRLVAQGGDAPKAPAVALAQAGTSDGENAEELKAMTNEVLRSLGAVTSTRSATPPPAQPPQVAPQGAQDYAQLMETLSSIVRKATLQGKSSREIMALIEEALAEQDQATLDALLRQAGGKVGLRKLLTTLVQKAAMQATPDDPYVKALQAEGSATRVAETGPQVAAGPDERTIVVQPGDTLSLIALKVYGSVGRWRAIFEANRDKLSDPDFVPVGVRLRLP